MGKWGNESLLVGTSQTAWISTYTKPPLVGSPIFSPCSAPISTDAAGRVSPHDSGSLIKCITAHEETRQAASVQGTVLIEGIV